MLRRLNVLFSATLFSAIVILFVSTGHFSFAAEARQSPLRLNNSDRVVLLGNTFFERMQSYDYLETLLSCRLNQKNVTFRNLGWSGDTVRGEARAVFGTAKDGFQRLLKDLRQTEPTVILINYGANEAYAGQQGIPLFLAGYRQLLDELDKTGARIVLLSPPQREYPSAPLPSVGQHNQTLMLYRDSIRLLAKQRGYPFFDISEFLAKPSQKRTMRITENGIHLSQNGYWLAAPKLSQMFSLPTYRWNVDIDVRSSTYDAIGTLISDVTPTKLGIRFEAIDQSLPYAAPPSQSSKHSKYIYPHGKLIIRGLPKGRYGLRIDGKPTVAAGNDQWDKGVLLTQGPAYQQVAELRRQVHEKNALFFYRYRPQNETYLFLFRKKEQGNNAVEIPQFDPLIAEQEIKITELRTPHRHTFELRRVK